MKLEDIAALLEPFVRLDQKRLAATSAYLDLLLKWNAKMNLTAVRHPEEIVTRHFGESFFAARRLLPEGSACSVVDLGSGAGFPGMPMAIFAPSARVALIEANARKAAFLNEAARTLDLKNVAVHGKRAEEYGDAADLVVMRAVEKFENSLPMAARLVKANGRLGIMIGASQVDRARELTPGRQWLHPAPVPGGNARVLLISTDQAA